jgi:hypothetical protein
VLYGISALVWHNKIGLEIPSKDVVRPKHRESQRLVLQGNHTFEITQTVAKITKNTLIVVWNFVVVLGLWLRLHLKAWRVRFFWWKNEQEAKYPSKGRRSRFDLAIKVLNSIKMEISEWHRTHCELVPFSLFAGSNGDADRACWVLSLHALKWFRDHQQVIRKIIALWFWCGYWSRSRFLIESQLEFAFFWLYRESLKTSRD